LSLPRNADHFGRTAFSGALFAGRPSLDRTRHRVIHPGEAFTIKGLAVTPSAVDHSTFGRVALLLEASKKSLLYSGDLRTHGRKPGMAKRLVEQIAAQAIEVFLTEGTHLGNDAVDGLCRLGGQRGNPSSKATELRPDQPYSLSSTITGKGA
jgi:mRNA degradation ribonuclease J1/J2